MSALGQALGGLGLLPEEGGKTSKQLVDALNKTKVQRLEDQAGQVDKARLMAVRAPHAGAWLGAVPSRNLDLLLTNGEIRSRVGRSWGQPLEKRGRVRSACSAMMNMGYTRNVVWAGVTK